MRKGFASPSHRIALAGSAAWGWCGERYSKHQAARFGVILSLWLSSFYKFRPFVPPSLADLLKKSIDLFLIMCVWTSGRCRSEGGEAREDGDEAIFPFLQSISIHVAIFFSAPVQNDCQSMCLIVFFMMFLMQSGVEKSESPQEGLHNKVSPSLSFFLRFCPLPILFRVVILGTRNQRVGLLVHRDLIQGRIICFVNYVGEWRGDFVIWEVWMLWFN